jgi:hypothetical protein
MSEGHGSYFEVGDRVATREWRTVPGEEPKCLVLGGVVVNRTLYPSPAVYGIRWDEAQDYISYHTARYVLREEYLT